MLFNSYIFLFAFLPITVIGYAIAARQGARVTALWLIGCSAVFYGWWDLRYLALLGISTLVNFAIGSRLAQTPSRPVLTLGIAFNLGLLGWFKYAGLFSTALSHLAHADMVVHVALPLGISFFVFQKIAYLVDCHRGRVKSYGLAEFTLFVWFFPQLIAGPIVHHQEFVSQYTARKPGLCHRNVSIGLTIFVIGLFKKVILAESMAGYATPLFDAAASGYSVTLLEGWSAAIAYSLQIYFDFSGYSDMAIGLARLFGIRFPSNFFSPYQSASIIDFWRRWHMTLSRFLRDYLYFPLGGNRLGGARRHLNLMVVMLLGGFWHGANWTFLAWGGLHGIYLIINHAWRALGDRMGIGGPGRAWIRRVFGTTLTYLAVVVAWVFFRSADFHTAINVLSGMAAWGDGRIQVTVTYWPLFQHLAPLLGAPILLSQPLPYFAGFQQLEVTAAVLALALLMPNTQQIMRRYRPVLDGIVRAPAGIGRLLVWRPSILWALTVVVLAVLSVLRSMHPLEFIYWQF